jgi:hypothetical protein
LSEKDLRTESDQRNKDNSKNLFTAPLYTSPINSLSPYLTDKEDGEIIKKKEKEQPIIHYYLKSMSIFNRIFKGSFVFFNKFVGFNFNHANNFNKFRENIYKFLFFSFKKMFSLISKPVFVITPDKVVIHLFYFILIPTLLKNKIIKKKNKKKNKMVKVTKKIFNCVAINNNSKNNNNPGPIET